MVSLDIARTYALTVTVTALDPDDDAALARRISASAPGQDAAAEAELCRRLGPRIRLYGLKHLRSEAAAADLRQDVLIMLITKLREGAVREPDRVASFVLGAARQMVIDGRRGGRRREHLLQTFAVDLSPAVEEPREPLDTDRLNHCLGSLPERERTVLLMTFYDDRPADAVAGELGLSAGNVRVIRHRGLERLRGCMNAPGGEA
jgi:RNA polymerase sigma-70 factor (ECF subfamily)